MSSGDRRVWAIFGLCAALLALTLGWVAQRTLELEIRERAALARADLAQRTRLALWRLDSIVAPIVAVEASRPYFHYRAFYPAEGAITRLMEDVQPGDVLVRSPVLDGPGPFVRLHFQIEADGSITSPQAPTGNLLDLAESQLEDPSRIVQAEETLRRLRALLLGVPGQGAQRAGQAPGTDPRVAPIAPSGGLAEPGASAAPTSAPPDDASAISLEFKARLDEQDQAMRQMVADRAAAGRNEVLQIGVPREQTPAMERGGAVESDLVREAVASAPSPAVEDPSKKEAAGDDPELPAPPGPEPLLVQGPLSARWNAGLWGDGPQLLLLREVRVRSSTFSQGMWFDWPALEEELRTAIASLLPSADLVPVYAADEPAARRAGGLMLATLPVLLDTGPTPAPPSLASIMAGSPVTPAIATAGALSLASMVGIALVLRQRMQLAERRGRFVSAVTHELRTPLTTFCLYTDMLASNMVPQGEARDAYVRSLRDGSQRLASIVENVIAFARLGRPRKHDSGPRAHLDLRSSITRLRDQLEQRAHRAGMELRLAGLDAHAPCRVRADESAIERIVLNLVDNACKHGRSADGGRVELSVGASPAGDWAWVRVCDFGPGVPAEERRRLFEPFQQGRGASATGGGLGLGLALSRALARELGGDLDLVQALDAGSVGEVGQGRGACFELRLPMDKTLGSGPRGPMPGV